MKHQGVEINSMDDLYNHFGVKTQWAKEWVQEEFTSIILSELISFPFCIREIFLEDWSIIEYDKLSWAEPF
jgi:hypothetical protein